MAADSGSMRSTPLGRLVPVLALIAVLALGYFASRMVAAAGLAREARSAWEAGLAGLACDKAREASRRFGTDEEQAGRYCQGRDALAPILQQTGELVRAHKMEDALALADKAAAVNPGAAAQLRNRIGHSLWAVNRALAAYRTKYGVYPPGLGPDGNFGADGRFKRDWIPGLVPEFIDELPRDPRGNTNKNDQYLYWSDGKDYKLISHAAEDCPFVKRHNPALVDPARDCFAYGYWTPGGEKW